MDKNKLTVLREIGYVIPEQCGLCVHFQRSSPGVAFGTCAVKTYEHQKHTGPARQLSVFALGVCQVDNFKKAPHVDELLGTWLEFLEKREYTRSNRHKAKTNY